MIHTGFYLPSFKKSTWLLVALGLPIGMFIGLIAAVLPLNITIALVVLPVFMVIALLLPQYAVIAAIFAAFGALPSAFLPQIPLAGGTVRAGDLFLAGVGGLLLLKLIAVKARDISFIQSEYSKPLLYFSGLVLMSSITALGYFNTPFKYYLYELRVVFYWLIFPITLYAVRGETRLMQFIYSLLMIGVVLAAGVVFQSITGVRVLEASRVEALATVGKGVTGITRSTAGGGIYFILFVLNAGLALWCYRQKGFWISGILIVLSVVALVVTFGRAVWAAEVVALLVMILVLGKAARRRAILILSVGVFSSVIGLIAFSPNMLDVIVDRVSSVGREVDHGESYEWRRIEDEYAVKKIVANPLFGVGLGGEYQPIRNKGMSVEQTRYIHHGYLYLVLKFGVLGIIFPIWIGLVFLRHFYSMRKRGYVHPKYEALAAAVFVTGITPFLTSFTQPEWMYHTGVAFFACSFATLKLIDRYGTKNSPGNQNVS